jgi:release factor glutamine methyltransferase
MKQSVGVWCIRKIQKYGPHRVEVLGNEYETSEDVFNPKYYVTSEFMARHIMVKPGDDVLDMGTGSGIQAITAAQVAGRVVAVDINPKAVLMARKNVMANGLDHMISVHEGDLFSPIAPEDCFDLILFTPPYLEGTGQTVFDNALFDRGKELVRRFFAGAKDHLKSGGYVQMVYSSIARPGPVLEMTAELGWEHSLLARKRRVFETFLIYTFRPLEIQKEKG